MSDEFFLFLVIGTFIGLFWAGIQFWFPYYIFHPNYSFVERWPTNSSSTDHLSQNENSFANEIDITVLSSLLAVDNQLYSLKGKIKVESTGRIFYEQSGRIGIEKQKWLLVQDLIHDITQVYSKIIDLGGKAVPHLQPIAINKEHILQPVAIELLKDIQKETKTRLSKAPYLICPYCLVYCGENSVHLSLGQTITYYACRACGQSHKFRNWKIQIIAILDNKLELSGWSWEEDILQVNWLSHRKLFDFDEVEIIRATDEDVERFVVQVGNDTDILRMSKYQKMKCTISSECRLSENTKRILQNRFGVIEEKTLN